MGLPAEFKPAMQRRRTPRAFELKGDRIPPGGCHALRPERRLRLTKVLVPVDFSQGAKNTLRYAGLFARQFGAALTLLHVVKPICEIDFGYGSVVRRCQNRAVVENARARLNGLGKRLAGLRSKPLALVRTGNAENEIVAAARQLESDLIILGTRRASQATATGDTAQQVLRRAPCPVLVVCNQEPA